VRRAADGLRQIDGGAAYPDSDLDLGLYYRDAQPPDLHAIRALNDAPDRW